MRKFALPGALLLAGCSQAVPQENASRPSERQAAVQKMQDLYLLRRGYFSAVPPEERPERIAHVQQGLRALGIPATIQGCAWMGVIANGNASGAYAFGGICKVRIADKAADTFIVCHDRIGGTALVHPDSIGMSDEDGELLLRRVCV
ncbi:MAG TPA: hypothetical protein VGB48_08850 [Allosphingosinicella sp.]